MARSVRPRDAASLILLRDNGAGLDVLLGRRGGGARFMPGHYVFPGGRVGREDSRRWRDEGPLPPEPNDRVLRRLARAALRETFEETGLMLGRRGAPGEDDDRDVGHSDVERAYAARRLMPAFDLLIYIGRAITPSRSPIRFHARFFLADGRHVTGEPSAGEELEDVHWHGLDAGPPEPMSDVTRFMLDHAVAVRRGTACEPIAFYRYIGGVPVGSAGRFGDSRPDHAAASRKYAPRE